MSDVVRLDYAYGVCPKCKCGSYLRYLIRKDGLVHKPYEIKCINCNSYFAKEDIWGNGEETAPKPMTNADKIRFMTDEELARFIRDQIIDRNIGIPSEAWLDWLREECDK